MYTTFLILLPSCFISCSDDSGNGSPDENGSKAYTAEVVEEEPAWHVNWQYNQTRPDWQEPQASAYENWTVITVTIDDELKATSDSLDMLAVLIGDEVCGLANPAITLGGDQSEADTYTYLMKVYSNQSAETYQAVTLKYYSASLQQVFTAYADISFSRYDDITELAPSFILGAQKYPQATTLQLTVTAGTDVQPAAGDLLAAFAGDECRGVCTIYDTPITEPLTMHVYGKDPDETVSLRYYHAASNRVFTFANKVCMADAWQTISINF